MTRERTSYLSPGKRYGWLGIFLSLMCWFTGSVFPLVSAVVILLIMSAAVCVYQYIHVLKQTVGVPLPILMHPSVLLKHAWAAIKVVLVQLLKQTTPDIQPSRGVLFIPTKLQKYFPPYDIPKIIHKDLPEFHPLNPQAPNL